MDMAAGTRTVLGTAAQLGLAQWLFTELDRAPGAAASSPGEPDPFDGDAARGVYRNGSGTDTAGDGGPDGGGAVDSGC